MNFIYILLCLIPAYKRNDEVILFISPYNQCTGIVRNVYDYPEDNYYDVYIEKCANQGAFTPITIKYIPEKFLDHVP